jgi:type III pantothenate kinase
MNLSIDIGNTQIKAGLFADGALVDLQLGPSGEADVFMRNLLAKHPVKNVILSSVANHSDELIVHLSTHYNFFYLNHQTRLPFVNKYSTPETLGNDRLSAIAGAYAEFPGRNVLVVDAGTCIKYDFISSAADYLGGGISPGIIMRYNALHHFTHKLPQLSSAENQPLLIGNSTSDSMHSGVINGAIAEVQGIIQYYAGSFKNICVILSGGDIEIFKPVFSGKNNIFADPLLILKGLNFILEYNVEKSK